MLKLKQGSAAIALVAALGLVVPSLLGGPASADISSKRGNQPMTIACDLDGQAANGYEYESKVNSRDHEYTTGSDHDNSNNTTEGSERFKFSTLQDLNSTLVFTPRSGNVTSIYTAIEDRELWPGVDDSDGDAAVPLEPDDARLAGGYPVKFTIKPDNPYAYFLGGFSVGASPKKAKLVDCDVTDVGQANPGDECIGNLLTDPEPLRIQGEFLDPPVCFQNWYPAGEGEHGVENCFVGGLEQDLCFVADDPDTEDVVEPSLTYHYTDIFHIKALVTNNNGAKAKAAGAGDGAPSADRAVKAKHGNHKGKG
jgi:hypothetical protein